METYVFYDYVGFFWTHYREDVVNASIPAFACNECQWMVPNLVDPYGDL